MVRSLARNPRCECSLWTPAMPRKTSVSFRGNMLEHTPFAMFAEGEQALPWTTPTLTNYNCRATRLWKAARRLIESQAKRRTHLSLFKRPIFNIFHDVKQPSSGKTDGTNARGVRDKVNHHLYWVLLFIAVGSIFSMARRFKEKGPHDGRKVDNRPGPLCKRRPLMVVCKSLFVRKPPLR